MLGGVNHYEFYYKGMVFFLFEGEGKVYCLFIYMNVIDMIKDVIKL